MSMDVGGLPRQRHVAGTELGSAEPPMEVDRRLDREIGAGIARAGPVKLGEIALAVAVGDRDRMEPVLAIGSGPQEGRPLGRHQPFVTVADIPVGIERAKVDRDMRGAMRTVDQDRDVAGVARVDQPLQWEEQRIR
jgi:hypothetical protein